MSFSSVKCKINKSAIILNGTCFSYIASFNTFQVRPDVHVIWDGVVINMLCARWYCKGSMSWKLAANHAQSILQANNFWAIRNAVCVIFFNAFDWTIQNRLDSHSIVNTIHHNIRFPSCIFMQNVEILFSFLLFVLFHGTHILFVSLVHFVSL